MHTHTEQEGIRVAIFLKKFFSNFLRKQAHARHFLWNFNLCVHISNDTSQACCATCIRLYRVAAIDIFSLTLVIRLQLLLIELIKKKNVEFFNFEFYSFLFHLFTSTFVFDLFNYYNVI